MVARMRLRAHTTTIRTRRPLGALAVVAAAITGLIAPAGAGATNATATLTGGSLAFVAPPPSVAFTGTLNGSDQTLTTTQTFDVGDIGLMAGWNVTATSTTFTNGGGKTLPDTAITMPSVPTAACDSGSSCTAASNTVSYPYSLPAAATAPTATEVLNADVLSGVGNQTFTGTWDLALPSASYAGIYTSTWTIALVSGP